MRVTFSFAISITLISASPLIAQGKAKLASIRGTVLDLSKDKSTIIVRSSYSVARQVVVDSKTKFRRAHGTENEPGAVSQVKTSNYISCLGTFNNKSQLVAAECVYREDW